MEGEVQHTLHTLEGVGVGGTKEDEEDLRGEDGGICQGAHHAD